MSEWTSTLGNTVEILPWMEKGFKFLSLDCNESIGGREAVGEVNLVYIPDNNDENSKMITDESSITIKLGTTELGTVLEIKGLITHRKYLKNCLSLKFSCFPRLDFWTHRGTLISTDINSAIKNLWGDESTLDIRTESDLPSGITFNQSSEFDYRYLQYLCESYKKKTIFAVSLDGLIIKDLVGKDSSGEQEPNFVFIEGNNVFPDSKLPDDDKEKYQLSYDPKLYMKEEDPWKESDIKSKYFEVRTFDDQYKIIAKDNSVLEENRLINKRFYNSFLYSQIKVMYSDHALLPYRLGDTIKYARQDEEKTTTPWKTFIISRIDYHYESEQKTPGVNNTEPPFSVRYRLHGIEENGKIMSDKDPIKSE